jgi:hypothetical protein
MSAKIATAPRRASRWRMGGIMWRPKPIADTVPGVEIIVAFPIR